jgi:hypothetical protein
MLYKDVNNQYRNEMYRTITPGRVRTVAKKYLNPNQRLVLDYFQSDKPKIIQNHHEKKYTIGPSSIFGFTSTNNPQPQPQLRRQLRLVSHQF